MVTTANPLASWRRYFGGRKETAFDTVQTLKTQDPVWYRFLPCYRAALSNADR
jgi:hypothetical protein